MGDEEVVDEETEPISLPCRPSDACLVQLLTVKYTNDAELLVLRSIFSLTAARPEWQYNWPRNDGITSSLYLLTTAKYTIDIAPFFPTCFAARAHPAHRRPQDTVKSALPAIPTT